MKVYIGCPIDNSRPEHSPGETFQSVAAQVVEGFSQECTIFNPYAAFANSGRSTNHFDLAFVANINQFALDNCNMGVFVWNGSPSYGTPLEIERCANSGRLTLVLNLTGRPLGLYMRLLEMQERIRVFPTTTHMVEWLRLMFPEPTTTK